jgi:hypothetical protein
MLVNSNEKVMQDAALISYGVNIWKGIAAGVNVKLLQEKVFGMSGTALGADVGLLYQPLHSFSCGLLVANVNEPKITLDKTPNCYGRNVKFGAAFTALSDRMVITADINKLKDEKSYFTFGLDVRPMEFLSFRAGFNQYSELTYGLGFNFMPISIDYSYAPSETGNLSRISFNYYWGNVYRARLNPEKNQGDKVKAIKLSGLYNELKFKTVIPDFVVKHWSLKITDTEKHEISNLEGDFRPPETIVWDMLDASGRPVKKGKYLYIFAIEYKNEKKWVEKGDFELDLSLAETRPPMEIKIDSKEYPQYNEPQQQQGIQEVPVKTVPAAAPEQPK